MKKVGTVFVHGHAMDGFVVTVPPDVIPSLEDFDPMPGPGKQSRRRYPGNPTPDDSDSHEFNLVFISIM